MDELESKLVGEYRSHTNGPTPDAAQTIAVVRRGARRQRGFRAAGVTSVAALVVIGLGAGAVALGDWRDVEPAETSITPSPSASPSPSAAASASVTPAPQVTAEVIQRDGTYPQAFPVTDDVWAQVGDGWALAVYSMRSDIYADPISPVDPAVVYLVSPDGIAYEALELDEAHSAGARVVSWHEDARTARVTWEGDFTDASPRGAGLLDLRTGQWDPIEFTLGSGPSDYAEFVSANAAGDELWLATRWADNELAEHGFFRWTAADGWSKSALTEIVGSDPAEVYEWSLALGPLSTLPQPSPDGNAIPIHVLDTTITTEDGSDTLSSVPVRGGTYRLDTDAVVEYDIAPPSDVDNCYVVEQGVGEVPTWDGPYLNYECTGEYQSDSDSYVGGVFPVDTGYDSSASAVPSHVDVIRGSEAYVIGLTSRVGYGEATPAGTGWYACLC